MTGSERRSPAPSHPFSATTVSHDPGGIRADSWHRSHPETRLWRSVVCPRRPAGNTCHMSDSNHPPDPLDVEAADIDPRSPEAVEEIEDLIEHAEELGRDPEQEVTDDPAAG